MTANPFEQISGITGSGNVPKADFVAFSKARIPILLADPTEVRSTTLAGQIAIYVQSLGYFFTLDTADTTTADDSVNCIISLDSKRFKRATQQAIVRDTRIDVRDAPYGAIGDGNDSRGTANRIAFQAAIDAVSATGGTVFVPNSADFRINGTLNLLNRNSIKIEAPGFAGALFDSASNTRLTLTAAGNPLFAIDGSEGIEICGLNLTYNNAAYGGDLIDLRTHFVGGVSTCSIHIHHCRIGGIYGVASGANSLVRTGGTLKVTIEHGFMDRGGVGILGSDNTTATNCVVINDIWFDGAWGQLPIVAGGQSWTIEKCIFERRSDLVASAIQTTNAGVISLNLIGNRFDDGVTTGTWVNINNGPVLGGLWSGNFFRNGARAIRFGSSKSVALMGNSFYALESTPPVLLETSSDITRSSNYVTTDSGLNIPTLS